MAARPHPLIGALMSRYHRPVVTASALALVMGMGVAGPGASASSARAERPMAPTPIMASPVTASSITGAPRGELGPGALTWMRCGRAQCARLEVPIDDAVPDGPTIELGLTRIPARGPRIGSLVVNPGGPGASGVEFVVAAAAAFPPRVRDRFDIVGFDPRGVGSSAAVDCTDDLDGFYALDFDPDDEHERRALEAGGAAFADSCARAGGALLPYLSTARTARDLDRIRAALGDEQLTYVGYSYGTYLGALYAEQFPDRVRALVLDGAIDPDLDAADSAVEQALGFEGSLEAFLRWCTRGDRCAFSGDGDPGDAYDELRRRAEAGEIASPEGRLNGTLFDLGVATLLYSGRVAWPALANSLDAASGGSGRTMLGYADSYTGREPDGTYSAAQESFFAISCLDGPAFGGVEGLRAIEAAAGRAAPRLGRSIVNNSIPCAFWPVPTEAREPWRAPRTRPILVLGTTKDPATPLAWARSLTRALGSARLVVVDGFQHTAFATGSACVDGLVARYLVELELPRRGTRC